ncbi:hypothetical protein SAMN05421748_13047 [Paractinoplanes atraurantiacus]|uniref:Uncharacterized protein n=1 Tax=Paractinoplanes atraurantiacus TaxID=1036182 RepID=A0A285K1L9_9ACTN|nr:hypothetical protein SAMN05421748_13047 [Actinoplanes atraurantiacus]
MDVSADFPAKAQAAEPVRQGEALLHDPAQFAEPGAVFGAAAGDDRRDAKLTNQAAVFVVVVAAVGLDLRRSAAGPAAFAADRWDRLQQRDESGDVVAVAAGQQRRKRDTAGVGDEVVFGAQPAGVYWTPALFPSRKRRQQVMPQPKPSSLGDHSQWMPVNRTNKMPHKTLRSSTGRRPGSERGGCLGSSGSIRAQRSSSPGLRAPPPVRSCPGSGARCRRTSRSARAIGTAGRANSRPTIADGDSSGAHHC